MRTTRRVLAATAVALLALTACGDEDEGAGTDGTAGDEATSTAAPTAGPPTDEAPSDGGGETPSAGEELPTTGPPPSGSVEEPPIVGIAPDDAELDAAIADLAENADVDEADVDVVSLEQVTWSDGSIGCPEPGRAYTQALVEGTRLVLAVDGEEFHYHAADDGALYFCADPVEPARTGDSLR